MITHSTALNLSQPLAFYQPPSSVNFSHYSVTPSPRKGIVRETQPSGPLSEPDKHHPGIFSRTIEWLQENFIHYFSGAAGVDLQNGVGSTGGYQGRDKRSAEPKNEDAPSIQCNVEVGKHPRVFADYHANRGVRSVHIESHCRGDSISPDIICNGYQLLSATGGDPESVEDGIPGFGACDRPEVGAVPDEHYLEWQLLVGRIAGLDGFVVEWGYPNAQSTQDKVISGMKSLLEQKKRGDRFSVVPLWIPTWSVKSGQTITQSGREAIFQQKLTENIQRYYQDNHCTHYQSAPLVFVLNFRGASTSDVIMNQEQLTSLFEEYPSLNKTRLAYRLGNNEHDWSSAATDQVVSGFPWIVPRLRAAEQSNDPEIRANFKTYGDREDINNYLTSIEKKYRRHEEHLSFKTMSVFPGVDTRAATWSSCNSYLPRFENGSSTFEHTWNEVLKKKPDVVIVETFNDFSEGTHIEPSIEHGRDNAVINAKKTCQLKGGSSSHCDRVKKKAEILLENANKIHKARTLVSKLKRLFESGHRGFDIPELNKAEKFLDRWSDSVFNKRTRKLDVKAGKFNNAMEKVPVKKITTLSTADTGLPELRRLQGHSKFKLTDAIPEDILSGNGYYTEGDIKLTIKRDSSSEQPAHITLSARSGKHNIEISDVYLSKGLDTLQVRIPLNKQELIADGKLYQNYRINHPGCTVEIDEIRTLSYAKII